MSVKFLVKPPKLVDASVAQRRRCWNFIVPKKPYIDDRSFAQRGLQQRLKTLACHYTWPKCWTEIVYLTGNHYKNWNLLGYLLGYPSEILYQPPKRGTHLEAREFILSQREFNTKKKLGFVQCSQSLCTEPGPNFLVVNGPWGYIQDTTGSHYGYCLLTTPGMQSRWKLFANHKTHKIYLDVWDMKPTKSRGKIWIFTNKPLDFILWWFK